MGKRENRARSGMERDSDLEKDDSAMPGLGRDPGGKTYDRVNPDPGRKQSGGVWPGGQGSVARRSAGGYGQLDDGAGQGFGVKGFAFGRETRSKGMSSASSTPTSVLNTGERTSGGKGHGDLDNGDGRGINGRR